MEELMQVIDKCNDLRNKDLLSNGEMRTIVDQALQEKPNSSDKLFYCKNSNCPVTDCIHRPQNMRKLDITTLVKCDIKHLEDNPLYCKKANWYGYQVNPEEIIKGERK